MDWFGIHWDDVARLTLEHLLLSLGAVLIAAMVAIPIALWAHGNSRRMGAVTGVTGLMYTIPSLALFALLVPIVGLGQLPAMIGLVLYAQLILIRSICSGLDAVPTEIRDAAQGMGIEPVEVLRTVDMPLALPIALSGLRVATVTVIGIATIGAVINAGGLGELILQGLQQDYPTKVLVGAIAVALLAIGADAALAWLERVARPWSRVA